LLLLVVLFRGALQSFAGFNVVIYRFFKSGAKLFDGVTVKADDVINAFNMTHESSVALTEGKLGSVSLIFH